MIQSDAERLGGSPRNSRNPSVKNIYHRKLIRKGYAPLLLVVTFVDLLCVSKFLLLPTALSFSSNQRWHFVGTGLKVPERNLEVPHPSLPFFLHTLYKIYNKY